MKLTKNQKMIKGIGGTSGSSSSWDGTFFPFRAFLQAPDAVYAWVLDAILQT